MENGIIRWARHHRAIWIIVALVIALGWVAVNTLGDLFSGSTEPRMEVPVATPGR